MSKLLLNEEPLLIMPQLATKIGLNESIILQQIHYWLQINKKSNNNFKDGYYWTYNSYDKWQEQFPFWSTPTIQRTIAKLEKMKLVIVGNYNKLKIDRTKWYRIDYDILESIENEPIYQNDMTNTSNCYDEHINLISPLPKTNSKTTPKTNRYIILTDDGHPYLEIYNFYFHRKFNKDHMKVRYKSYLDIELWIQDLIDNGIDRECWIEQVELHFNNLPSKNNGNILAFMEASKRYFEVNNPSQG